MPDLGFDRRILAYEAGSYPDPQPLLPLIWEDTTSYQQGERGRIAPRQWTTRAEGLVLNVHTRPGQAGWWLTTNMELFRQWQLAGADLGAAQAEAVEACRERLISILGALGGACA